jgi:hypothetical protein
MPCARACMRIWSSLGVQAPDDARTGIGADWDMGGWWYERGCTGPPVA